MGAFLAYEVFPIPGLNIMIIRSLRDSTLRITLPFGRSFFTAVAVVTTLLVGAEALSRTDYARSHLEPPDVTNHPQLGVKLQLYERRLSEGPVNCLLVGSSMVFSSMNPETIATEYRLKTGGSVRCFNFGLNKLDTLGAANLTEILLDRYHPQIIIFGLSFRDFISDNTFHMDQPWALYELGEFSIVGWLAHQSLAYQYYETYKYEWVGVNSRQKAEFAATVSPYGFSGFPRNVDVTRPPAPEFLYASYAVEPIELDALDRILQLKRQGVSVVLIELPLAGRAVETLPNGEADYQLFLDAVTQRASAYHIPFWRSMDQVNIPPRDWYNYLHLSTDGAEIFSQWLGDQMAARSADLAGRQP